MTRPSVEKLWGAPELAALAVLQVAADMAVLALAAVYPEIQDLDNHDDYPELRGALVIIDTARAVAACVNRSSSRYSARSNETNSCPSDPSSEPASATTPRGACGGRETARPLEPSRSDSYGSPRSSTGGVARATQRGEKAVDGPFPRIRRRRRMPRGGRREIEKEDAVNDEACS